MKFHLKQSFFLFVTISMVFIRNKKLGKTKFKQTMKKLFRNNVLAYLLVSLLATQMSCSSSDKKNASSDSETAYNDLKNYVSTTETNTRATTDSATTDWEKASADERSEYDAKVAAVDQYQNEYDASRRQEIDKLKARYSANWESRNKQHQTQINATGTNMSGGLAASYDVTNVANIESANIRMAYENFVEQVRTKRDNFTKTDWQAAENYFKALDSRKDAVENQLSDNDKHEIGKAKSKYTALKAGRLGIDASEAGNKVSDEAKEVGSEVKDAAVSGADKVENVAEKGAKKVGNSAEKVGSQVKSTVKSGAKKIDRKIDDNPNKD